MNWAEPFASWAQLGWAVTVAAVVMLAPYAALAALRRARRGRRV